MGRVSDLAPSRVVVLRIVAWVACVLSVLVAAMSSGILPVLAAVVFILASAASVADNGLALTSIAEAAGHRWSGKAMGAEGDRAANALILDRLRSARPDDAVLSEESVDDPIRLSRSRVWIVDPLDGTREYAEGRDDWAVHIGLAVDGAPAIGAVALPARGMVLATRPERAKTSPCAKLISCRIP